VICFKAGFATLCAGALLLVAGVTALASELSPASIHNNDRDSERTPPNNWTAQPMTKAQVQPDISVDQGAFWTPEEVGPAYDLSGPVDPRP
jgi:hypothetical protein